MKTALHCGVFLCLLGWSLTTQAVVYDHHEIGSQLSDPDLLALSRDYQQQYFTAGNPDGVVDQLMQANLSPLHREYILHELLLALAQQPPQDHFQNLVDNMKQFPVQAMRAADEGPLPVPMFPLNSQAAGIEHVWTMYRSENRIKRLLVNDLSQAVAEIATINAQPNQQRNPQWLGVKRSLQAIDEQRLQALANYLYTEMPANAGHDPLISQVGLITGDMTLLQKALSSKDAKVRDWTLRQLPKHLNPAASKSLLLMTANSHPDDPMSTALLASHNHDLDVHQLLVARLNQPKTTQAAAFALSQTKDPKLIQSLQAQYKQSQSKQVQKQILLALKLNPSPAAQMAVDELLMQHEPDAQVKSWLQSLSGGEQ